MLARYFVVLDRGAMQLKLLPPGPDSAKPYEDWAEAKLTRRACCGRFPHLRFWYLSARFNERHFVTLFDLGAGITMMNWDAAEQLGLHKKDFAHFGPPPEILQDVLGKTSPAVRITSTAGCRAAR